MRGKALPLPLSGAALGITPAYAGKSSKRGSNSQWLRDHPRVCGEKCHVPALRRCEPGSPPRMRGKGAQYSLPVWRHRITPAYAGKSLPSRACPPSCWDHPRVCGEKHIRVVCGCTRVGSPPRMRGKEAAGKLCSPGRGITPAYAGKRRSFSTHPSAIRDHPRVCGEKKEMSQTETPPLGSPPRMRGKELQPVRQGHCPGITPAYAGKSPINVVTSIPPRDHPRVCGEKPSWQSCHDSRPGSPPRMRGKACGNVCNRHRYGITPAYAGKSAPSYSMP